MRPRLGLWLLALSVVLLTAAGCGGGGDPLRIGVITDCPTGSFGQDQAPETAGAELPLIRRGARLSGATSLEAPEGASVGGHPVQLEIACAESFNSKSALFQLRWLVESRHVAAVVAPMHELDTFVARYARQHPEIVFMLAGYDQSSTLRYATPNMFRFELDNAQLSAGLAAYAYRRLGWRNVTTVGQDDAPDWSAPAGFDAEFCALGGHVRQRLWAPGGAGGDRHWARHVSSATDGVFLAPGFYTATSETSDFLRRWARHHDLSRQLVVGWDADKLDPRPSGVVAVSSWPWAHTPAWQRFEEGFKNAFPKIDDPDGVGLTYYDEVEPLLEALEKVHGDTSKSEQPLQDALADLHYASPEGPLHLDGHHQGIGPTYLGRMGDGTVHQFAVIPNVDETFGGYFGPHSAPPGPQSPACVKKPPPPWAA